MSARRVLHLTCVAGRPISSFSRRIKALRQRFGGKQWWLAYVAGCSDAAVSFWESGKRIPSAAKFTRILDALAQAGATPGELSKLRRSWLEEKVSRRDTKGLPLAQPVDMTRLAPRPVAPSGDRFRNNGAYHSLQRPARASAVAERKAVR
jgi:DNA-binding transcriptional regulator YiaG